MHLAIRPAHGSSAPVAAGSAATSPAYLPPRSGRAVDAVAPKGRRES